MAGAGDHKQPLWSRNFILAILAQFFIGTVFYLLITTMALYAVEQFRASESAAGLASSIFVLGALAARVFAGKYLDFIGRRRLLLLALALYAVAGALYIPADELGVLLGIRAVHGMAFGAAGTAVSASVVGLIPVRRRAEGMGYFGISTTMAAAIGPFLALLLADTVGYTALFLASTAASVAALIIALPLRLPERVPTEREQREKWRMRLTDVLDPNALPIALVMFLGGVAYSSVMAFLASYASDLELLTAGSLFFLVYAAAVLVSRLFIGRIHDRRTDNTVVYPTLVAFAAGLAVLGLAQDTWGMLAAAVLIGLGFGGLMPSGQTIAVTSAPDHRIGIATSTFYLMLDAGCGVGPLLLGTLIPLTGFNGMYLGMAGLIVATMGLYHVGHGRRRGREQRLMAPDLQPAARAAAE